MKVKRIKKVDSKEFVDIYGKKDKKKQLSWKEIFNDTIKNAESFTFSHSFWYIGDFSAAKIVAVGGDCDNSSPLTERDWLGLHPMEIGKLFHPLDMSRMQAFTVFIAGYLASMSQKQRDNTKISMLFRMLDSKKEYTWRLMQYPKMYYENNMPKFIFCQISDYNHLVSNPKCTMYILDNNTKENTLFYCDEEQIELKPILNQRPLTDREHEVLKLLSKGLISKEIAEVLKISKNTVENHKQNIFSKTSTKNLAELVAFAHKQDLA